MSITKELFIERAKLFHGEKYDYSQVDYVGSRGKVKIICPSHGVFFQRSDSHLSGSGCNKCGRETTSLTEEAFVKKARMVHGERYDYSSLFYNGSGLKVDIICPQHGVFSQVANSHLMGEGCPSCSGNKKSTTEEFKQKATIVHKGRYDYTLLEYINSRIKVKIICTEHGSFLQSTGDHLNGVGCPRCCYSHGELEIRSILQKNNLKFVEQYRIKACRNKKPLPFDFAIFENENLKYLIEYDGIQHFVPVKWFGGLNGFNRIHNNDLIKTQYCIDNNIELIRIKYDEEDIETKINKLKLI